MGLSWSQDQLPIVGTWSWTVSEPHSKIEKADALQISTLNWDAQNGAIDYF